MTRQASRSLDAPNYLNRSQLEALLQSKARDSLCGRVNLTLLDLGCGTRIYESYFEGFVGHYVGADIARLGTVDVTCAGEGLPFPSATFDVVLCSQVLEHVDDPPSVVSEIGRILRPNGVLFLSTHGTMVYHPTPGDYWRWTQTGLIKLISKYGAFRRVEITPVGGTFTTLAFLFAWYFHLFTQKVIDFTGPLGPLFVPIQSVGTVMINLGGLLLDRLLPDFGKVERSNTLFLSFLVVGWK